MTVVLDAGTFDTLYENIPRRLGCPRSPIGLMRLLSIDLWCGFKPLQ